MSQDPTPPFTPERLARLEHIPLDATPSPAYVVQLDQLEANCRLLADVAETSGAKILLALKGFACHAAFPVIAKYLHGVTASGLHEALLGREYFGKEVHVYSPAFSDPDLKELSTFAHTIVFNSPGQLAQGLSQLNPDGPQIGLRVNPEHSEGATELYDPCAAGSRLGTTRAALDAAQKNLPKDWLKRLDGLHFHTLCEQDADALERTAAAFEEKFGDLLPSLRWLNFGGGHHITRPGYDLERLCTVIRRFRDRYELDVYLEPGEAVALHSGVLVATVLDILESGDRQTAILDASATCHMPDVLEMPYRPNIHGAGATGEHAYDYRIGGPSCLAGDVIGDYSFDQPLAVGHRLMLLDMAHYTMVKNTTFNGVPLPAICTHSAKAGLRTVRSFGYEDYANRLS
ncbi:MAG: carboxynorspermidine decarboxylase [Coraliomargaritaceae bacterium]